MWRLAISIVPPDDDTLGRVAMGNLPDGFAPDIEITLEHRDLIERKAVVSLAGDTAERHYLEQVGARVDDVLLADQAACDFGNAANSTSYLCGHEDEHNAYLQYLVGPGPRTGRGQLARNRGPRRRRNRGWVPHLAAGRADRPGGVPDGCQACRDRLTARESIGLSERQETQVLPSRVIAYPSIRALRARMKSIDSLM